MTTNTDRLGYYLVGGKKFYNKTLALLESAQTNYEPEWIFNNDVYSNIDWSIPIADSLSNIYRRRAQQLRDEYDYLCLHFSGGADSMNILHAFIDNDIFLDEIVMQRPESALTTIDPNDTSNANFWSETVYSAIPHLKKHVSKLDSRTKIRFLDFEKSTFEILEKDHWFDDYPMGGSLSVSLIGRQISQLTDNHILDFCYQGLKVAQIVGIDKPLVWHDGDNYYGFFMDLSAYHYNVPVDYTSSDVFGKHYRTEFFYWTPDMPEIVIKQAQEIKRHAELNPHLKSMLQQSLTTHIDTFRDLLHPIIYSPEVKIMFRTEKPPSYVMHRPMDHWFWKNATDRVVNNYLNVINYLKKNIKDYHGINNDLMNGINGHLSPFYKL